MAKNKFWNLSTQQLADKNAQLRAYIQDYFFTQFDDKELNFMVIYEDWGSDGEVTGIFGFEEDSMVVNLLAMMQKSEKLRNVIIRAADHFKKTYN